MLIWLFLEPSPLFCSAGAQAQTIFHRPAFFLILDLIQTRTDMKNWEEVALRLHKSYSVTPVNLRHQVNESRSIIVKDTHTHGDLVELFSWGYEKMTRTDSVHKISLNAVVFFWSN